METATQPENSAHFESFELKLRTRELYCNGMRLKIRCVAGKPKTEHFGLR